MVAIQGNNGGNEITPTVEIANKIAKALDVSLDYLAGNNPVIVKDKKILEHVEAIANMPDDELTHKKTTRRRFNLLRSNHN